MVIINDPIFLGINSDFISEQIFHAEKSVFLVIPGITNSIVDALMESQKKLGSWDNINIVIDPSPKVYYLGYSDHEAFKRLEKSGCSVKCEKNLRIGVLMVDGQIFIFSPTSLNLESNEDGAESVNAIALHKEVSRSIIQAITPVNVSNDPEIGKREISEIEIKIVENAITSNPPQKPDLTRKISILTSQFQFVDISFKGSQLKNTKISLNGNELGIADKDLVKRISGQYKVLEQLPEKYVIGMESLKQQYKQIKECYTKTIGEYGTIVWISQIKEFEEAVKGLKSNIDKFNKNIIGEIIIEINNSKDRLKKFINEHYKESPQKSFNSKLAEFNKDKLIESIIDKAFSAYTQQDLEKNLELKYHYYNISSQMAVNESFNKKIADILGVKLDDLVKHENAFGVESGY